MKNKFYIGLLCLIFAGSVLLLSACSPTATETHPGDSTPNVGGATQNGENPPAGNNSPVTMTGDGAIPLSAEFITENGVYRLISRAAIHMQSIREQEDGGNVELDSGQILSISNSLWDSPLPLCDRPECRHDNAECAAYFNDGEREGAFIFVRNSHVYIFAGNTLYRTDLNGRNRQTLISLPDAYQVLLTDPAYYFNSRMYITAYSSEFSAQTGEFENIKSLIELDYASQNYRVIAANPAAEIASAHQMFGEFIGFGGDYVYYLFAQAPSTNQIIAAGNQEAYIATRNDLPINLHRISLADGRKTEILSGVRQDIDSVELIGGRIFYHSRSDSRIMSLDLSSLQTTELAGNVSGLIRNMIVLDGRLIYYTDVWEKPDDVFFVELASGQTGVISYRADDGDGHWAEPIRNIKEWGAEHFLFLYSQRNEGTFNESRQWNLISRADFWNDNFENMQVMGR